jgi:ATP-dependent RNA helicase DeaD
MLAERSAEEIASALARLYRSRLPSPEDVQDPGTYRGREDRAGSRNRGEDGAPVRKTPKKSEPMGEGAKWFRVAIGRQKNAEARWLLPMICRRGGIEKADIGAIKIYDGNSEFEISAAAAEKFMTMIKRPDKEDNIHIEPLANGPEGAVASRGIAPEDRDYSNKRPRKPSFRSDGDRPDFKDKGAYKEKSWKDKPKSDKPYQGDKPRYEGKPRYDDKPKYEGKPKFEGKFDGKPKYDPLRADKPAYAKPRGEDTRYEGKPKFDKKPRADKPAYVAKAKRDGATGFAKPGFGKKKKTQA